MGIHPQSRIDEYTAAGWWTDETGDGLFRAALAAKPDQEAIVDPANRADLVGSAPRRLTWTQLAGEVDHLSALLLDAGIGPGDVVGVQLPNLIELPEVYLAAWTIGAAVSPLAVQYREHEIRAMAQRAAMKLFLTVEQFQGRRMAAEAAVALADLPAPPSVVVYEAYGSESGLSAAADADTTASTASADARTPPGTSSTGMAPTSGAAIGTAPTGTALSGAVRWEAAAASPVESARVARHLAEHPSDPGALATICWTSGTESTPKGVMRAHYDWLRMAVGPTVAPKVTGDDVLLNTFPLINMAAITGMLLPWLTSGCKLVQHQPFDMPVYFQQIATERVTYTLAPPALLWLLLGNDELAAKVDLSSVTRVGSGSAPLQPPMVRGWQETFGIGVINFFGSNEGVCLLASVDDFPDPNERAQFFPRYGASDREWTGDIGHWVTTKVVDLGTGEEITEPGRPGELYIKGPHLFAGYVGGKMLDDLIDADGFFGTGDLFEIAGDNDEYLHYVDRAKDMIIRGGMNIAPAELEALILDHPAVAEVAVVGELDEQMGERVTAIVALRPEATLSLDELVDFLRGRKIASYKLPQHLVIRAELPRNPVGKLLKRELKAELARDSTGVGTGAAGAPA